MADDKVGMRQRASFSAEGNNLIVTHKEFKERVDPVCCCYYLGFHGTTDVGVKCVTHSQCPGCGIFCCCPQTATHFEEYNGCGATHRDVGEGCCYGEEFKACSIGLVDYRTNHKLGMICCPCMTIACNAFGLAMCCFKCVPFCYRLQGSYALSGIGYRINTDTFLQFTTDLIAGSPQQQSMR